MSGLAKGDPFRGQECPFNIKCWSVQKADCWKQRIVYRLECTQCGVQYTGTSGHSLHKRLREHMDAMRRGDLKYAMAKHYNLDHPLINIRTTGDQLFRGELLSQPTASNMERYILEGLCIEDALMENSAPQINSRGE